MVTTTQDVIRLDAWRAVFEKTNRILSEQKVTVQIVPEESCPVQMRDIAGWTDGLDIHLNGRMAKEMIKQNDPLSAVLRLKGLNYHELCHVLFTPRMSDDIVRRVIERARNHGSKWWYAFNALEDQRIETWFTASYGSSRRYFEAVILEWIIKNGNAEAAILVYGRKYLSPRIRVQTGRVFKKKYGRELYEEFKAVIDEYITLVLPSDSVRALECIRKFVELLDQMQAKHQAGLPPLVINDNGMHNHGNPPDRNEQHGVPRAGRVLVKQARKAKERAEDVIDDAIDADLDEEARREEELAQQGQQNADETGDDGQGDGQDQKPQDDAQEGQQDPGDGAPQPGQDAGSDTSADSQDGGGEGDGEQAGQDASAGGDGDAWDDWADNDATGEQDSTSAQGGGAGSGAGDFGANDEPERSLEDELRDMVEDAYNDMDEVREDEWVQEDVGNILDAVRAMQHNGELEAQGREARNTVFTPSDSARLAVRRVSNILTRIRQEAEPETLKRQVHGRVDIRRALTRQSHEVDLFKQWDSGSEEETGMEAVILVDVSGSMGGRTRDASEAMWALKRSFDKLDIRTTVMLYNTDHLVLFQPSDKANPVGAPDVKADGGTNPLSALIQARNILTKSHSPNKVLITVTDGGWQCDEKDVYKVMKPLHRAGVVSMLLGLDEARKRYGKHHHQEAHDLHTINELPKAALKMVGGIMRAKSMV